MFTPPPLQTLPAGVWGRCGYGHPQSPTGIGGGYKREGRGVTVACCVVRAPCSVLGGTFPPLPFLFAPGIGSPADRLPFPLPSLPPQVQLLHSITMSLRRPSEAPGLLQLLLAVHADVLLEDEVRGRGSAPSGMRSGGTGLVLARSNLGWR